METETARLSKPTWRRRDRGGDGATLVTKVDTARLRKWRGSKSNGANGQASATKNCKFKTFATAGSRREFPDRGGDDATKNHFLATKAGTARLSKPRRRRRGFSDQGRDGANFQTRAETTRPIITSSRPLRRRRANPDQSADGETFQN